MSGDAATTSAWLVFYGTLAVGLLGAAASIVGALFAHRSARALSKEEHKRALEAATQEALLRVNAERELEFFKVAAASVEPAHLALTDASEALLVLWNHAHSITDGNVNYDQAKVSACAATLTKVRRFGLMMPPELDGAFEVAKEAVSDAYIANHQYAQAGEDADSEEADAATVAASDAMRAFTAAARTWKAGEWARMSGKAPGKKCAALQAARLKKQLAKKAETKP